MLGFFIEQKLLLISCMLLRELRELSIIPLLRSDRWVEVLLELAGFDTSWLWMKVFMSTLLTL